MLRPAVCRIEHREQSSEGLIQLGIGLALGQLTRIRDFTRRDVDRWAEWGRHTAPLFSSYNPTPMTGPMRDSWFDDLVNRQGQLPYAIEDLDRRLVGRLFLRHVRQREGT